MSGKVYSPDLRGKDLWQSNGISVIGAQSIFLFCCRLDRAASADGAKKDRDDWVEMNTVKTEAVLNLYKVDHRMS